MSEGTEEHKLPEDKKNTIRDDSWQSTLGRIIFVCIIYFIYPLATLFLMDFLSFLPRSGFVFAIVLVIYMVAINLGAIYILYSGRGSSSILNFISWIIIAFSVVHLVSVFTPFIFRIFR